MLNFSSQAICIELVDNAIYKLAENILKPADSESENSIDKNIE